MNRLRLIPVVIFAVAALLVVKGLGIATNARFGQSTKVAVVPATPAPVAKHVPETDLEYTSAAPKKDDTPKKQEPQVPPAPAKAPETPAGINVGVTGENSPAQKALLERLQERRQELDARARDLDLRENLIKEAEKRLEQRINELKVLEDPANAENPSENPKIKNLVTMYEAMKPKDAARIFEKLDNAVLLGIAKAMKPVKLSEIMAVMNPEAAQTLTADLARGGAQDRTTPPSDLPRVNLPTPKEKQAPQQQSQTQTKQPAAPKQR